MDVNAVTANGILCRAISGVRERGLSLLDSLDTVPAAMYVTDAEGMITYFNRAAANFAGRMPRVGEDRWCVSHRLLTEAGDVLAHEDCPMAIAIRERRPVRGAIAVAERPDGSRISFMPFPTPIFDDEGVLIAAVNLLIDVADRSRSEGFRVQAERCRRLAASVADASTVETLTALASEYDDAARQSAHAH